MARDWGYCDEAATLPTWAKPEGNCDPAFRNIRAGLGGVPIVYRLAVKPKTAARWCWASAKATGPNPASAAVVPRRRRADPQTVDPVAKWGRHKPGVLLFAARDANGDGRLDVDVRRAPARRTATRS